MEREITFIGLLGRNHDISICPESYADQINKQPTPNYRFNLNTIGYYTLSKQDSTGNYNTVIASGRCYQILGIDFNIVDSETNRVIATIKRPLGSFTSTVEIHDVSKLPPVVAGFIATAVEWTESKEE